MLKSGNLTRLLLKHGCRMGLGSTTQLVGRTFTTCGKRTQENTNNTETSPPVHFRASRNKHPLNIPKLEVQPGDHKGRLVNHVWTNVEIEEKLGTLYMHKPQTLSDKAMYGLMRGAYHSFNFITNYKPENTPVRAVEWRLLVLESVAGVPGFMAAGMRHFSSLRGLKRDHGWIHTLLEEAENERMHLLTALTMFKVGPITRGLVVAAQCLMTPLLWSIYVVNPKMMHRFVGYLEETACETYANIIRQVETKGTPLNEAWADLPAPDIAKGYWQLGDDALWLDTLKCMFADEANHRDVNHTFATMESDDPNPFIEKHLEDAAAAWRLETKPAVQKGLNSSN